MKCFSELNLAPQLMQSLAKMNFTTPTPIQAQSIPAGLEGRDVLGSAATGTGKTGAFGIPLVNRLLTNPRGSALILCPTRELAMQVQQQLKLMVGAAPIKTALLIGGESMPKQLAELRLRPRIIVGTPGRINDHLERGSLMLHDANFLVLDETDRMLDMGFGPQIEKIFKFLPAQRQTLMYSATIPDNIAKISQRYLKDPVRVSAGEHSKPAAKITQENIHVTEENKFEHLLDQLNKREGSVIIFVKTKWNTEKIAKRLRQAKHSADAIHGDLRQNQRDRVIKAFRDMHHRILVATDIAARGLDIPHIEHVINYDLPMVAEDYIHRIGRTARNDAEGAAVNLITKADGERWQAIVKLLDPEAYKKLMEEERANKRAAHGSRPRGKPHHRGKGPGNKPHGDRPHGEAHGGEKREGEGNGGKNRRRRFRGPRKAA